MPVMALHDDFATLRSEALANGRDAVPNELQGVSKDRIRSVLSRIDRNQPDIVDAVFALLDDRLQSFFAKAPEDLKFYAGASTAQVGCHIGILQRGQGKLDREGRDYWLKPLWQIGAIEKVYWNSPTRTFLEGHPKAKSPNSAYRLADSFKKILIADDEIRDEILEDWISGDAIATRLVAQAAAAERSRELVETGHVDLIRESVNYYVPRFLEGYEVLFVDDEDGDRISEAERVRLERAGLTIELSDAMPDVLLWNPQTDMLWVIEAVTSDGEVDSHKVSQMTAFAQRFNKAGVGFTTTYPNWKVVSRRQSAHKNIPPGTFIWIAEEPAKQLEVKG